MVSNPEGTVPRRLKVDLADLESALEETSWEASWYLDLETGQALRIDDETRQELEALYAKFTDAEGRLTVELTTFLKESDLPEWRKEALAEADMVEKGYSSRFVQVPHADTRQDYQDLEEFIDTIEDEWLRDQLSRAIRGRGAFRRFRDVIADFPEERERWFAFKSSQVRARILAWLASEGIEPIS